MLKSALSMTLLYKFIIHKNDNTEIPIQIPDNEYIKFKKSSFLSPYSCSF